MSLHSQAAGILRNEDIVFSTEMQVFIVRGHGMQRVSKWYMLMPNNARMLPPPCSQDSLDMIPKEEVNINLTEKPRIENDQMMNQVHYTVLKFCIQVH